MEQRGDTFNRAMDRLRDEMAREKGQQLQLLGEGLTAMLQLHPEWADALLKKNTSIVGALDLFWEAWGERHHRQRERRTA